MVGVSEICEEESEVLRNMRGIRDVSNMRDIDGNNN